MMCHPFRFGLVLAALGVLIWLLFPREPARWFREGGSDRHATPPARAASPMEPGSPVRAEDPGLRQLATAIEAMLSTPITFYGKVVDQHGNPVPHASVDYGLYDKFNQPGSVGKSAADGNGQFTLNGISGAVITVSAHKNGYLQINELSHSSFAYGYGTDWETKPPPTRDDPAVFVLHRIGPTEPLVKLTSRQFQISPSGELTTIPLTPGGNGGPVLQVSSRVSKKLEGGRFDWDYELSIPGGGLVERRGPLDFHAPESGYAPSLVIGDKASDPEWRNGAEKSYFVRFPDQTHARIQIRFYPRDYRNILVLESFHNPKPGSRNLAFDPNQPSHP